MGVGNGYSHFFYSFITHSKIEDKVAALFFHGVSLSEIKKMRYDELCYWCRLVEVYNKAKIDATKGKRKS